MKLIIYLILIFYATDLVSQIAEQKTISFGFSVNTGLASKIYKAKNATSDFRPNVSGLILGHFDLSTRIQLRGGIGLNYRSIYERDYSPIFASDWDSNGGLVNSNTSYFDQNSENVDIIMPVNVRIKLFGESNHIYFSSGLTLLQSIIYNADIYLSESGLESRRIVDGNFYKHRRTNIAFISEIGYEFGIGEKHKMSVYALMMNNLMSDNLGGGSAMKNIIKGRIIMYNLGVGFNI